MDMLAGLVGFSSFVLALLLIGSIGYWKAEPLEVWTKNMITKKRNR